MLFFQAFLPSFIISNDGLAKEADVSLAAFNPIIIMSNYPITQFTINWLTKIMY